MEMFGVKTTKLQELRNSGEIEISQPTRKVIPASGARMQHRTKALSSRDFRHMCRSREAFACKPCPSFSRQRVFVLRPQMQILDYQAFINIHGVHGCEREQYKIPPPLTPSGARMQRRIKALSSRDIRHTSRSREAFPCMPCPSFSRKGAILLMIPF
jgi:hypothetical protein